MTQEPNSGREHREDTKNDQSLDRGYGGLPGKRPDEDFDDDVTDAPAADKPKRRPTDAPPPGQTKH